MAEGTEKPDSGADKDIQELTHVLDIVGERVPKLITAIKDTIYSEAAGRDLGKAVGAFYKGLVESGIPAEAATGMAKDYISSLQNALSTAAGNSSTIDIKRHRGHDKEE